MQVAPLGLPGPLPLEIQVRTKAVPQVRRVELRPGGGSWTITSPEPARDVRINEDRRILAETEKVRRVPQR